MSNPREYDLNCRDSSWAFESVRVVLGTRVKCISISRIRSARIDGRRNINHGSTSHIRRRRGIPSVAARQPARSERPVRRASRPPRPPAVPDSCAWQFKVWVRIQHVRPLLLWRRLLHRPPVGCSSHTSVGWRSPIGVDAALRDRGEMAGVAGRRRSSSFLDALVRTARIQVTGRKASVDRRSGRRTGHQSGGDSMGVDSGRFRLGKAGIDVFVVGVARIEAFVIW